MEPLEPDCDAPGEKIKSIQKCSLSSTHGFLLFRRARLSPDHCLMTRMFAIIHHRLIACANTCYAFI